MPMESDPEIRKIELGQETLKNLNTLRKWTMFLAVSGFIFLGLIIALGLITGTFLTTFNQSDKNQGIPDALLFAAFIGLTLIIFFPILFLFRFSKHTSNALSTFNGQQMHIAIKYLKRFFIFMGILVLIVISLYIVSIILAGASAAFIKGL